MTEKKNPFAGAFQVLADVASFGLTMGAGILVGYFFGSYLDRKFGTAPWLMLVFLLLFMVGSFIKFFQSVRGVSGNKTEKKQVK